jgi:hypothetical protein
MKKIIFLVLLFSISILSAITYLYNTKTKQVFVNYSDIKVKDETSSILYYANDDVILYLNNSNNEYSTFVSTINISTKQLNCGTTIYYYDNGIIKSSYTYSVEQSTGT